jgi:mycothiol synthase
LKLIVRQYIDREDYGRVREFLRDVYRLNNPLELSWQVYRFDYWRWHCQENIEQFDLEEMVSVWETSAGQIGAVLLPEGKGEAHFLVHPHLRTAELEAEMLARAEERLAVPTEDRRAKLLVYAHETDALRRDLLASCGYTRLSWAEHQRRRSMDLPIQELDLAKGYTIRSLGEVDELPARSLLSWRAFHPDEPDERYEGWEWYLNVQRCPLYQRDLDLVAVAPDGELAAFCTVWFDDVTRTGAFEPVGTAPAHQRRGLGKAVMSEGLRRLKRLGATMAYVASYSPAAHATYESVGFTDFIRNEPWEKEW